MKRNPPIVSLVSVYEGGNIDTATARTVAMMAAFAADAAFDLVVQSCARRAALMGNGFPPWRGATSSLKRALGVWLWLKHCIRFRRDEATMARLGVGAHHDLVVDPRVLVRMKDPAEDCDGFTCLAAALCRCLAVPYYFATAATEPQDPSRWSHTWLMVGNRTRLLDLDASHGEYFGWGVPAERRFRFGLWDSAGERVI